MIQLFEQFSALEGRTLPESPPMIFLRMCAAICDSGWCVINKKP